MGLEYVWIMGRKDKLPKHTLRKLIPYRFIPPIRIREARLAARTFGPMTRIFRCGAILAIRPCGLVVRDGAEVGLHLIIMVEYDGELPVHIPEDIHL